MVLMGDDFSFSAVNRTDFWAGCIMGELDVGPGGHGIHPNLALRLRGIGLKTSSLEVGVRSTGSTAKSGGQAQQQGH